MAETELDVLRRKLAARTDGAGKPKPGFEQNVSAVRARIAELEAQ